MIIKGALSATAAPYRAPGVADAHGPDLRIVEAVRNRPWIDITAPNISGQRVDVDLIAETLDQWGGWNAVEAEWRWRQLAEALTGMASVNRDASMRLRGFCLTHFGPPKPVYGNPQNAYWDRKAREAAMGRVPTNSDYPSNVPANQHQSALYYNANEEWVSLPSYPERMAVEGTFKPGTATLQGGVRFGRF